MKIKKFLQRLFIYSYGTLTKLVPFILYAFILPIDTLDIIYWVAYGFISFINLMILLEIVFSWIYLIKEGDTHIRVSDIKQAKKKIQFNLDFKKKRMGIILVAYLPNEYQILPITVKHMIEKVSYDYCELTLLVVYNGSQKLSKDIHEKFKQDILTFRGKNPCVNLILKENVTSTSKVENVNYGIDFLETVNVDYIGILDSDHLIHPLNLDIICARFEKSDKPDIIQGRCTIRNDGRFISQMVGIDFDQIYCIGHLGGYIGRGYGIFGGSNGYWKLDVIRKIRFDKTMLTEDIDASFRALEEGYKIVYCRTALSSEEAPPGWIAFSKQRTRWSQGWLQVTLRHTIKCLKSKNLSIRQKIATFIFLPIRDAFEYLSFHTLLAALAYFYRCNECNKMELFWLIIVNLITPMVLFVSAMLHGLSGHPGWIKFLYPLISIPYGMVKSSAAISAHAKQILGIDAWVVTPRTNKEIQLNKHFS